MAGGVVRVDLVLALVPLIPLARPLFGAMGHEPNLAHLEAVYLQIVLISAFPKMVGTAFGQFLLAVNRPGVVFASAAVGVGVNLVAAYGLVLGRLGLPCWGIVGSGWAQNIGVTVETLVLVVFAMRPWIRRKFNSLDWRPRTEAFVTLLKVGWPSGLQFVVDVLAWAMFSMVVMNRAGEAAMEANVFTFRFMSVSFMPALGIGTAITALVGRYIGRGRPDLAIHRANLGFKLNAAYMVSCGLVFYFWRHELMRLFTNDPQVLNIGGMLLIFAALYQFADAVYCTYAGALRGAGDTLVPAVATAVLNWSISVGLGWLLVIVEPRWGAAGPWAMATVYGFTLSTFIYLRFRRGGWKRIRLEGQTEFDRVPGVVQPAG